MKHLIRLLMLLSLTTTASALEPLTEIKGQNVVTSENVSFSFPSSSPFTVLIFMSAKCPCSASHEVLLKDLAEQYKEYSFVGVHANADEDAEITTAHFKAASLPFPVLQDMKGTLANKLGALKTPHAFVLNKKGEVIYQGGVTDSHVGPTAKRHFLKEVLEDLRAQKIPRHKEGRALGCYIQREDE